ncbi:MAG: hypothetical protein RL215_71 [Planctomycetota bacterium]
MVHRGVLGSAGVPVKFHDLRMSEADGSGGSMRRLTVLQIIPALEGGGAERCVLAVNNGLVLAGHRSLVASGGGRLVHSVVSAGGEHFELPVGSKSPQLLRSLPALRRLLGSAAVDVVDVHSRLPAWLVRLVFRTLRRQSRPALVMTVHGLNSPGPYSRVMLRGDAVVAVSGTVRSHLRAIDPRGDHRHVIVIPRGVDGSEFPRGWQAGDSWRRAFERQFPELCGRQLLTMPGRLVRSKGHADLLRLLAELFSEGRPVHGVIVGDTAGREHYAEELRELAKVLGVADRVTFTGFRSDMREIYSISAIVLSLSQKPESFGLTVAEAISLGIPVVGYAHGGVSELLREAFPAGAVEPGNLRELADRVRRILDSAGDEAVGEGLVNSRPGLFRYDQKAMVAGTLELYAGLDAARRSDGRR